MENAREVEVIKKLREALDILKAKYIEVQGGWFVSDILSASQDKSHWMHDIAEAEKLSDPYLGED